MDEFVDKEVHLTIRVPKDFDREDERMLDDAFSRILEQQGWSLVDSKEYRDLDKPELEFLFADELCVQDEHLSCVDGYLAATDSLVGRMKAQVEDDLPLLTRLTMDNINFYAYYDLSSGEIQVPGTFWYYNDKGEAKQGEFKLNLNDEEADRLVSTLEQYCEENYHVSCMAFVNEARTHEGFPALDVAISPGFVNTLPPEEKASLDAQISSAMAKMTPTTESPDWEQMTR